MDPVRNPYAPGAGQRPPELAGREAQLRAVEIALDRLAAGRPERSVILTGLRGVGKTVLLNAMRSAAVRRGWGTGKWEARPDQRLRRPLSSALHQAIRELGGLEEETRRHVLGVVRSFAEREAAAGAKLRDRWASGIDVPAVAGRADSGDIEIDLVELLREVGGAAGESGGGAGSSGVAGGGAGGRGVALFVDEMQDLGPADVSAICAACHEIGQLGLPVLLVGAGLPHLPAVLAASKSYSERLFAYHRVDRLARDAADLALVAPAEAERAAYEPDALSAMYAETAGYPYFIQAYGKAVWDLATGPTITAADVAMAAPEAAAELAVGFFGSRLERATPAERDYLRAMADAALASATSDGSAGRDSSAGPGDPDAPVATSEVAARLGKKPQSLSPARDALLKKGLIYSAERGRIAFTVPHFGHYLRAR